MIVTRHRSEQLQRCLKSLLASSDASTERLELSIQVLLDGGEPSGETEAVLRQFPSVRVHSSAEKIGPVNARNRLLDLTRESSYAWVFFVDDDAYVQRDYFSRFISIIQSDPEVCVLGGPNLTPPGSTVFQFATGEVLACRLGSFLSTPRYLATGIRRESAEQELILCNLWIRRDWMEKVRFPSRYVCAEENRLLQDLKARGARLIHDPGLSVFHERRETPRTLAAQVFKYGTGRGQNLKDAPQFLRWPYILPSLVLIMISVLLLGTIFGDRASAAVLAISAAAYLMSCAFVSARLAWKAELPSGSCRLRLGWDCFLVFPIIHFSYALGVLRGMAMPR